MTRAVTAFKMSWKRCIDVDKVSKANIEMRSLDKSKRASSILDDLSGG